MMLWRPVSRLVAVALALGVGAWGCEEKKEQGPAADAGPPAAETVSPVLGGRLAAAVKSAAAKPAGSAEETGPPPDGVFGPGQADKVHASGAPLKIELFAPGGEPRVGLRVAAGTAVPERVELTVSMRAGTQMLPTLEYVLGLQLEQPEGQADGGAAGPLLLAVKVAKVSLAASQPGRIPPGLERDVAKIKGTSMRLALQPDGSTGRADVKLGKGTDEGLRQAPVAAAEALGTLRVVAPAEPVGQGAYWMVTDRTAVAGVPVLRYRVYRVQAVAGDELSGSLEVRQYAAKAELEGEQSEGLAVGAFDSQGKGSWTQPAGAAVVSRGEVQLQTRMQLTSARQPQQLMLSQMELRASLRELSGDEQGKNKGK
ncbi:MAG: hypothetical protein HY744_11150 [Deltaproteobacteria bacterium]|nr:hypothetical protein [Deltaproteobacteria bacterium]